MSNIICNKLAYKKVLTTDEIVELINDQVLAFDEGDEHKFEFDIEYNSIGESYYDTVDVVVMFFGWMLKKYDRIVVAVGNTVKDFDVSEEDRQKTFGYKSFVLSASIISIIRDGISITCYNAEDNAIDDVYDKAVLKYDPVNFRLVSSNNNVKAGIFHLQNPHYKEIQILTKEKIVCIKSNGIEFKDNYAFNNMIKKRFAPVPFDICRGKNDSMLFTYLLLAHPLASIDFSFTVYTRKNTESQITREQELKALKELTNED